MNEKDIIIANFLNNCIDYCYYFDKYYHVNRDFLRILSKDLKQYYDNAEKEFGNIGGFENLFDYAERIYSSNFYVKYQLPTLNPFYDDFFES